MIRLAHLSDLHFGKNFNLGIWTAVAESVVQFEPDLIIVSGDLVDHPSPLHLLSAKCALRDLSLRAREDSLRRSPEHPRAAELVVVPGNHDVFEFGTATILKRLTWFEQIFDREDTIAAEVSLESELGCKPGFNSRCLDESQVLSGRAPWIREFLLGEPQKNFTEHLPELWSQKATVRRPKGSPVLLALLDSNPSESHGEFDLATGIVDEAQLSGLAGELRAETASYLARIAVVHHHVLPIAFAPGLKAKTEPMMVLRNAGAVLRVLADHRFDLVLHGHWHQAQFARVDLGTSDSDSYPMGVVAAGSATLRTNDPDGNSFNLITIEDNGRVAVKTVFYGAGQSPQSNGEVGRHFRRYVEPTAAVKRRAYFRALERHPIRCDLREQACEITETGDLRVTHSYTGFQLHGEPDPYPKRPLIVTIPKHGREGIPKVDQATHRRGVRIVDAPDFPNRKEEYNYYWIKFPGSGLRRDGSAISFSFAHAVAYCMTMTQWEADQKADFYKTPVSEFEEEWVGTRVSFPTAQLILSAKFPESLIGVQPYVRCAREPNFPAYEVNQWGDVKPSENAPLIDSDMGEAEEQRLQYDACSRTWRLAIERPIVGYQYELRWKMPQDEPDKEISSDTREFQRLLLEPETPRDAGAIARFEELVDILRKLCRPRSREKWVAVLFAYDRSRLSLRPSFSYRSWSKESIPSNFEVPLGGGVSGAAFLQRRMVAWGKSWARDSLIQPIQHGSGGSEENVELKGVLSLPFYHPKVQDDVPRPPPWATIGVVSFASASEASQIAALGQETPSAIERCRELRGLTQAQAISIVDSLL